MSKKKQELPKEYYDLVKLKDKLDRGDKAEIHRRLCSKGVKITCTAVGYILNHGTFKAKNAKEVYEVGTEILKEREGKNEK